MSLQEIIDSLKGKTFMFKDVVYECKSIKKLPGYNKYAINTDKGMRCLLPGEIETIKVLKPMAIRRAPQKKSGNIRFKEKMDTNSGRTSMRWTEEALKYLRDNYPEGDTDEIAKHFGISRSVVMVKASALKISKKIRRNAVNKEKDVVEKPKKTIPPKETLKNVPEQKKRRSNCLFTPEEDQLILQTLGRGASRILAAKMKGRTETQINQRRWYLRVTNVKVIPGIEPIDHLFKIGDTVVDELKDEGVIVDIKQEGLKEMFVVQIVNAVSGFAYRGKRSSYTRFRLTSIPKICPL